MIIPIDEVKGTISNLGITWRPRHWAHIVVAVAAGFVVAYNVWAPAILFGVYATYQVTQMWSRKIRELRVDGHKDIAEFAYFFIPTYVICLILQPIIRYVTKEMLLIVMRVF